MIVRPILVTISALSWNARTDTCCEIFLESWIQLEAPFLDKEMLTKLTKCWQSDCIRLSVFSYIVNIFDNINVKRLKCHWFCYCFKTIEPRGVIFCTRLSIRYNYVHLRSNCCRLNFHFRSTFEISVFSLFFLFMYLFTATI